MRHRASEPRAGDGPTAGLIAWRCRRLQSAGFEIALAQQLASDRRIDVHGVLGLIDRGCPPELAARILAPLDDDGGGSR